MADQPQWHLMVCIVPSFCKCGDLQQPEARDLGMTLIQQYLQSNEDNEAEGEPEHFFLTLTFLPVPYPSVK